jgi:hypothetical protein
MVAFFLLWAAYILQLRQKGLKMKFIPSSAAGRP